jgi:cytochrome c-type biogenesis protein
MGSDLAYLVAFGGGLISFLSPCVLPLVPAYLSIVSGLDAKDIASGGRQQLVQVSRSTLLFVAGFTIVFTALGLTASAVGRSLQANHVLIDRIGGVVVIGMALFILLSQRSSKAAFLVEKRFHPQLERFGIFAAPVAGMAFGFGWTPCIGPILASVLAFAATQAHLAEGALLLVSYSLGLAIPLLATGLIFSRLVGAFSFVKRHFAFLTTASSLVLLLFGLLLVADKLTWVTIHLQDLASAVGLGSLNRL